MKHDDQASAPTPATDLPARRSFTTPELEAVIRRALELQAGGAGRTEEGIDADDVVRIGQDLGLEPAAVRRAMAEVHGRAPERRGALDGFVGAAAVRASRVIPRAASDIAPRLDSYLRDVELLVVQRRLGERTKYVQDSSFAAGLSRLTRGLSRSRQQPLNLTQVDVAVSPLDAESALVEVAVDLATVRGGLVAGVFGSTSVAAAGWATAVWATPIADPLMLLGVPLLGGAWAAMRGIYGSISRSHADKLELLLDRLEHGDI